MRRYALGLTILLAAFLSVVLNACVPAQSVAPAATPSGSTELDKLDVCMSQSPVNVLLTYAAAHGLFAKYGLDVTLHEVASGTDSAAALVAGNFDLCQVAGSAVVNAALAGHDLVIAGGIVNQQLYSLVVAPNVGGADDLRSKVVAANRPGGSADTALRQALQQLGLDPDVDVTIVAMGGQGERLAALASGQIAGTVMSVPDTAKARELGYPILLDAADLAIPYQHTTIATSRAFLAENRAVLTAFMQAVGEATAQMRQDRAGTLAALAQLLLMDPQQDAAYLAEAYDGLVMNAIDLVPIPNLAGVQTLIDEGKRENPTASDISPASIVDASIVRELESRGFYASLPGAPAP